MLNSLLEFGLYLACFWFSAIFLVEMWLRSRPAYKAAMKIPGGRVYPIVGNVHDALFMDQESNFTFVLAQAKKFKAGYRYYVLDMLHYWPIRAHEIEFLMNSTKHIEKSVVYRFMQPILGNGLLVSSGNKWHKRRKILTPAFHFNILQQFLVIFKEESQRFVEDVSGDKHKNGTELQDMVSRFTLSNICETAMGVKLSVSNKSDLYRQMIYKSGEILVRRFTNPILGIDFLFNFTKAKPKLMEYTRKMHDFSWSVIDERRKTFNLNNSNAKTQNDSNENIYSKARYAMLDTLLEAETNGQQINEEGIREEVDTFMFEGYDTTSSAVTFLLFTIAQHQDVQQKLIEEIREIYETKTDDDLSIHDYGSMKYMDLVIKETFRMYPPVPYISRCLHEDVDLGHVILPKRTQIHLYIYNLHRDPDQFPDPDRFDPDRFLPENSQKRHIYSYIPFSAGPRNCIGQKFAILEIKTLITSILLNYRLEAITKLEDIVILTDLVLRTKEPIKIKFVKR